MNNPVATSNKVLLKPSTLYAVAAFIGLFLIGSGCVFLINASNQRAHQQLLKEIVTVEATDIRHLLEQSLTFTEVLALELRNNRGDFQNFEAYASEIIHTLEGVASLQLAPDGVIAQIYPLRGNEKLLGKDLRANGIFQAAIEESIETRTSILIGPLQWIKDSQQVMAVYNPVYLPRSGESSDFFWGFAATQILLRDLIAVTGLNHLAQQNYRYQLSQPNKETGAADILAQSALPLGKNAVSAVVPVHNGVWHLHLSLAENNQTLFVLGNLVSVLIAAAIALLVSRILREPERLRERALQKTHEHEALLDNIVDGILTIDHMGTITHSNPACEHIFGYSPDEMLGKNVKMLMPDPYHSEHDGYLNNYHSTGIKKIIGIGREVEGLRKNGEVFALDLSVSEVTIEDQRMFTGVVRDISERKAAEVRFKNQAREYDALMENIVDGILTIDKKGTITRFNPACERIFGYSPSEMIGQNVKMLMPDPYHSEHDGYLHNYSTTGEKKIIGIGREVQGKRKNGEIFPLDLAVSEIEVEGQRMFTGVVRDVSERKAAEARTELIKNVAVAANAAQGFEQLLEMVLTEICQVIDYPLGHVYHWEEDAGHLVSTQIWYCHANREKEFDVFIQVSESMPIEPGMDLPGRVFSAQSSVWLADIAKDDNFPRKDKVATLPVQSGFALPVILNGTVQFVIEFFSDFINPIDRDLLAIIDGIGPQISQVSERNTAQSQLRESIEKLEISNKELDDFAYIASHDLKEPLRGVHNNAIFLQEDYAEILDEDGVKNSIA